MDYDSLNSLNSLSGEELDYLSAEELSAEELKEKFPDLYKQMCELIRKKMAGATVNDWADENKANECIKDCTDEIMKRIGHNE